MYNVPLVFQLWENPQKKITYEKEVCNSFRIIMCIKLVGLFTETLVCVIVNDPLVLFITFIPKTQVPDYITYLGTCIYIFGKTGGVIWPLSLCPLLVAQAIVYIIFNMQM
jgi:hypothetical protein